MIPELNIERPASKEEALRILETGGYKIISGGTDIIVELRKKDSVDFNLLDISAIDDMRYIKEVDGKIHAGSRTTFSDILSSDLLLNKAPLIQKAVENSGCLQIRNRATIGGNASNASPAADSVPALCALDAEVVLLSLEGRRILKLQDYITGAYRTAAKDTEILEKIIFSPMPEGAGYSFIKLARREALAISRMNVAAYLLIENGKIKKAAVSPGSVMPSPGRISEAEELLTGESPSMELFKAASEKVGEVMIQKSGIRWSTEYKKPVIEAMVRRALGEAASMQE